MWTSGIEVVAPLDPAAMETTEFKECLLKKYLSNQSDLGGGLGGKFRPLDVAVGIKS